MENIELSIEEKEHLLKDELRLLAIKTRYELGITQKEMSKLLSMAEGSYSDIESGEYMCGTLTTVLLLAMQPDPSIFLSSIKTKFSEQYERAMQSV